MRIFLNTISQNGIFGVALSAYAAIELPGPVAAAAVPSSKPHVREQQSPVRGGAYPRTVRPGSNAPEEHTSCVSISELF
jgi:hypothetical protein